MTTELTARDAASATVNEAFKGFIGNSDAVYSIKRALTVSLARAKEGEPPILSRTYLLAGPPSTGKTEIARRMAAVLKLPFLRLDGRAVKSREKLFEMIGDALLERNMRPSRTGSRAGMPVEEYPPFVVFIDEIHLVSEGTQEAFLTLLEADDRSLLLDGQGGRRVAIVRKATFIFATTRPSELDRAFRSRCTEIQLLRYSTQEVQVMVHNRFPHLPDLATETIASCSRQSPRQAFEMATEVEEEILLDPSGDTRECVRRVMNGRGIKYNNGVTEDDKRYLKILSRERKPLGESIITSTLYDVDPSKVADDIEPFLLSIGYITITPKGRIITLKGTQFIETEKELNGNAGARNNGH
jgi:Holliday junction resolvasome RuvABC ATP-dependent DNA helicase subunit